MRAFVFAVLVALVSGAPPPAADAPLPGSASGLANALTDTNRTLESEIRGWLRTRPQESELPPAEAGLRSLYQQRIYRLLRERPALAARVIAELPASLRLQAHDNIAAGRSLLRLAPKKRPKTQPPIRTGTAEPPRRLLGWYRTAER